MVLMMMMVMMMMVMVMVMMMVMMMMVMMMTMTTAPSLPSFSPKVPPSKDLLRLYTYSSGRWVAISSPTNIASMNLATSFSKGFFFFSLFQHLL